MYRDNQCAVSFIILFILLNLSSQFIIWSAANSVIIFFACNWVYLFNNTYPDKKKTRANMSALWKSFKGWNLSVFIISTILNSTFYFVIHSKTSRKYDKLFIEINVRLFTCLNCIKLIFDVFAFRIYIFQLCGL